MPANQNPATTLADRLCRPQRLGVFGHRGVGKTTLLTMLYREAVGGRLPGLRLAAADARTAAYLAEKILHLESGQPLPATLAETELRWHLYHGGASLDVVGRDYQGEHVELGREEPVRDFLRDCDAVWLCLDAGPLVPAERLRRQQEAEQLVEDYLSAGPHPDHRPTALVLTKSDLLGPESADPEALAVRDYGMTWHALRTHCPRPGLLAVSSLGGPAPGELRPRGLGELLTGLAVALRAQDEARLDRLWSLAPNDAALLDRCVACFARRYSDAPVTAAHQRRLRSLRSRTRRRRGLAGLAAAAVLAAGVWAYDALGHRAASGFEAANGDDPPAVLRRWQSYRAWHPTRNLLSPAAARAEQQRVAELARAARRFEYDERLAELRRLASGHADAEAVWEQFRDLHARYPDVDAAVDVQALESVLRGRRDEQRAARARRAFDELRRAEGQKADLAALLAGADRFLSDFEGTPQEPDARRLRDACLLRLDERDIEAARAYSAAHPLNFQTRREHYQRYLDAHPRGAFAAEAGDALKAVAAEWDRHDFRGVRDHFLASPGDVQGTVARCRTYLAVHPNGRFAAAALDLLRWTERVTAPREYRVTLRGGEFDPAIASWLSRGPDLSVEIEVGGVRHGPSPVVPNQSAPEWDYEFPRPVRWKLGDPVRIWVTDHDWKDRVVLEVASDGDPVGLRLLSGAVNAGKNRLTFESDFKMPDLPSIE